MFHFFHVIHQNAACGSLPAHAAGYQPNKCKPGVHTEAPASSKHGATRLAPGTSGNLSSRPARQPHATMRARLRMIPAHQHATSLPAPGLPPWPSNLRRPHTHSNMKATPSRWWGRKNCTGQVSGVRRAGVGCRQAALGRTPLGWLDMQHGAHALAFLNRRNKQQDSSCCCVAASLRRLPCKPCACAGKQAHARRRTPMV